MLSPSDAKIIDLFLSTTSASKQENKKAMLDLLKRDKVHAALFGSYTADPKLFETFRELSPVLADETASSMERIQSFKPGQLYASQDLSFTQQPKTRHPFAKIPPRSQHVFTRLGFYPTREHRNVQLLNEYLDPLGRILHSRYTGLDPKRQNILARTIRRARCLAFIPFLHRVVLHTWQETLPKGASSKK